MITTGTLDLVPGDDTPLVARGEELTTRGGVRSQADVLADVFDTNGAARVLVESDDPVVLLAVLDAAERTRVDVFVAHTVLPAPVLDEIVARHGVEWRIGDHGAYRRTREGGSRPAENKSRVFMMTSGTTGQPKIAEHSLASLSHRARRTASSDASRDGRWLLTYVPTGFAGLQVILTATLARGLIVVPEERTPAGFLAAATRSGVTHVSATPTFFRSLLMLARPSAFPVRHITLGAEGVDQSTLARIARAFPDARLTHVYASTEAGVVFAVHDGKEGFPVAWLDTPPPGVTLRVVDGFLHVQSGSRMRGYVSDSGHPLRDDGWLETADRVEIAGDRVRFLGRGDSTINVGGSKVYPLAVESFLMGLPGVVEARVYPVPSPVAGAIVGADVVLAPDTDRDAARLMVLAACREKLPRHEVPRVFRVVDAIEVGSSGKKT